MISRLRQADFRRLAKAEPRNDKSESDYVKWMKSYGVRFKRLSGNEYEAECPFCDHDDRFYVNIRTGQYYCQHASCEASGNWETFTRQLYEESLGEETQAELETLAEARDHPLIDPNVLREWGITTSRTDGTYLLPGWDTDGIRNVYRLATFHHKSTWIGAASKSPAMFLTTAPQPGQTIIICEGVWDAMVLWSAMRQTRFDGAQYHRTRSRKRSLLTDYAVVGLPGATSVPKSLRDIVAGHDVILALDNDEAGRKGNAKCVSQLSKEAKSVRSFLWEEIWQDGTDISDLFEHFITEDSKHGLAKGVEYVLSHIGEPIVCDDEPDSKQTTRESKPDRIIELLKHYDIWTDPMTTRTFLSNGQTTVPLRSTTARQWLMMAYYDRHGTTICKNTMQDTIDLIDAMVKHDGPHYRTYNRIGGDSKTIYIDAGRNRVIVVTADGWDVQDAASVDVRFCLPSLSLPLPEPSRDGDLTELRQFLNLADEDWPVVAGWLVAAARPSGPYPILSVNGREGSAKSTIVRVLKTIIDPQDSTIELRPLPISERDIAISARASWILAYDNLSALDHKVSDILCRMSTGGGFATRRLYSDDEEQTHRLYQPVILSGIPELARQPDLLDRCVVVTPPPIKDTERQLESVFWPRFHRAWPTILGGLLDTLSIALGRVNDVHLTSLPRMADFAVWATAAEPGLGLDDGEFLAAYTDVRCRMDSSIVENSPIAEPLLRLIRKQKEFEGTMAELMAKVDSVRLPRERGRRNWPRNVQAFSTMFGRLEPTLERSGIRIKKGRSTDRQRKRIVRLWLE